jgi:hypothetical protein
VYVDVAMLRMFGELDDVCLLAVQKLVEGSGHIPDERPEVGRLLVGEIRERSRVPPHNEDDPAEQARAVAVHDVPGWCPGYAIPVRSIAGVATREQPAGPTVIHDRESISPTRSASREAA